jgi:ubiquinol-cytochrome c reductase cytochrome c subunit
MIGVLLIWFLQPPASADRGKQLFMSHYCYSCHGTQGHGGAGPRLVVGTSPDALIRYVRKPSGTMPAYTSKSISEPDLRDIHAFLRSIPASPAAKTIPMLQR